MNATPAPDFIDPIRRDAVRRLLHDTVQDPATAPRRIRRRRVVRFAALGAAAVVVLGAGGLAYAGLAGHAPHGGTAVAPPATTAPAPSQQPSAGPVVPPASPDAPEPEPAGTATPLPTPTPTQYSQSDTSSWRVSFDGIGPLGMGHSQKADAASLMTWRQLGSMLATCHVRLYMDDGFGPDLATASSAAAPDVTAYIRVGDGFDASQDPQDLAALSPRTSSGIRIGSTLAQLRAAYPAAVHAGSGPNPGGEPLDYWSVSNGAGRWIDFGFGTDSQVAVIVVGTTSIPLDENTGCE